MAPTWIWQQPLLLQAQATRAELLAQPRGLETPLAEEAVSALLSRESLGTAAIEGEALEPAQVRSSIARRLGLDSLHQWHRRLFAAGPDGLRSIRIGELRGEVPIAGEAGEGAQQAEGQAGAQVQAAGPHLAGAECGELGGGHLFEARGEVVIRAVRLPRPSPHDGASPSRPLGRRRGRPGTACGCLFDALLQGPAGDSRPTASAQA